MKHATTWLGEASISSGFSAYIVSLPNHGIWTLRLKESDRLATTAAMIASLGGSVLETEDGLTIRGISSLDGGTAGSAGDHRIAMAAAVAACACAGSVTVTDAECVAKSYPGFWEDLKRLEVC